MNEHQLYILERNQEALKYLEKVNSDFKNTQLIATEIGSIAVWKIMDTYSFNDYFYIPSNNHQRMLHAVEILRYSKGIATELINEPLALIKKENLEKTLKPYHNLEINIEAPNLNNQEKIYHFNIHFHSQSQSVPFKLDLFKIKDDDFIQYLKNELTYFPYYQEMLEHTQLIEEKIELEKMLILETQPPIKVKI